MMKRTILSGPDFLAVAEDGMLTEYLEKGDISHCGDIVFGTVERMMPGIGSAFVNIGRKRSGFLPLHENSLTFRNETLKSGMKIAVQIRKEEKDEKGAFLSRDLALAGKNVLLMPMNRYIGVSARISDDSERQRLQNTGKKISDGKFGLVMRSASSEADLNEIAAETESLEKEWRGIKERIIQGGSNGTVLYHPDPIRQITEDYEGKGTTVFTEVDQLDADLQRQLHASRERKVLLKNGGNIIIDPCEALTVIDVNSGPASSGGITKASYIETNLAACEAIAAQIRLRNLSGIILIDFIDMDTDEDRNRIAETLRQHLERDRRKTVIHGWTKLGILEMTRKRTV